tara:strand:+ start:380 stop:622 length:243 start_codon:yes stop_codon:yes gene_type:complete
VIDIRDDIIQRAVKAIVKGEFPEVSRCTVVVDVAKRTIDVVAYTGDTAVHGLQPCITSMLVGAMPRGFKVCVEVYDSNVH